MTLGYLQEEELSNALRLLRETSQQKYCMQVKDFLQKKYRKRVKLVNSGSEALYRVFVHIKRNIGNKSVLVPAYTCYAPVKAAITSGLKVVLVDVTDNFGIDPNLCEKTEEVGAIVVVHPYGIPLNMKRFRELAEAKSAILIEDFAQSYGAKIDNGEVGVFGDYSILSFRLGKHISGIVGGAILSEEEIPISGKTLNHTYLESQIRMVRRMLRKKKVAAENVGEKRSIFQTLGSAYSMGKKVDKAFKIVAKAFLHKPNWEQGAMSNSQAYLTYTQLKKEKEIVDERDRIAQKILGFYERYSISKPKIEPNSSPSFISVPLLSKNRSGFEQALKKKGVYYEKKYNYSNVRLFPFLNRVGGENSIRISREIITFSTDPFHASTGNYDQLEAMLADA
jgi:dTDP-4-amino-4,6-dideoxygalactose transaminase